MDPHVGMAGSEPGPQTPDTLLHGLRVVCLADRHFWCPVMTVLHALGAETITLFDADGEPDAAGSSIVRIQFPGNGFTINLKSEAGQEIVRRVMRTTDVLLVQTGDDDDLERHPSVKQFQTENPGLIAVYVPRRPSQLRETKRFSTDARGDREAWEIGVLLAGLWYRDRNNGKGAKLVMDERLTTDQARHGVLRNRDTSIFREAEDFLMAIDFGATETKKMIDEKVIRRETGT